MHQQHTLAVQLDHARVGQQCHAGLGREGLADQEVAIAVHEEDRGAALGDALERSAHAVGEVVAIVIADPDLEDVTQQEQTLDGRLAGCQACQIVEEALGDLGRVGLQVQVGDEEGGGSRVHGRGPRRWAVSRASQGRTAVGVHNANRPA